MSGLPPLHPGRTLQRAEQILYSQYSFNPDMDIVTFKQINKGKSPRPSTAIFNALRAKSVRGGRRRRVRGGNTQRLDPRRHTQQLHDYEPRDIGKESVRRQTMKRLESAVKYRGSLEKETVGDLPLDIEPVKASRTLTSNYTVSRPEGTKPVHRLLTVGRRNGGRKSRRRR